MARIRSIHPGLMTDEAFMALSVECPLAVLLYLGLLMEADDHGLFEWKIFTLKARILPAVSVDIETILAALVENRFIIDFEISGKRMGAVRNFMRYQKPKKPHFVHRFTADIADWIGMPREEVEAMFGTGGEPVGNQTGTGTQKPLQREREREEEGEKEEEETQTKPSASSSSDDAASDLETICRKMVGSEPCIQAFDFHTISALVEAKEVTREDVLDGIRIALEKADPQYRFRAWRNFVNWIRGAAKDRLGANRRTKPALAIAVPDDPADPAVKLPGGGRWRESSIRKAVERWQETRRWPDILGSPPGKPGCHVPKHLLPEPTAA